MLYYVTPKQYRAFILDQQQHDPKAVENFDKKEVLEELLLKCSFSELISTLIMIFKEKYANPLPVWTGIVDYEMDTLFFPDRMYPPVDVPVCRPAHRIRSPSLPPPEQNAGSGTADFGKKKTGICADPATGLKCKLPEFCTRY